MRLAGFNVSIRSEGKKLKEYSVDVSQDGKEGTCWIPSQSGKAFTVKYSDGTRSTLKGRAKVIMVFVDGRELTGSPSLPHHTDGEVDGVPISNDAYRPLVFAEIQTTDGETAPTNEGVKLDEIGAICIRVYLAKSWTECTANLSDDYKIQDCPPAVVDERDKKAGDHCVSLGDEKQSTLSTWYNMDYDDDKPDLVFKSRYHSVAMLQALGIAPLQKCEGALTANPKAEDDQPHLKREASPAIGPKEEDDQPPPKRQKTTDNEDLIRSMQAELERLKNRVEELEGNKAGPSHVKRKVVNREPAKIIDLT